MDNLGFKKSNQVLNTDIYTHPSVSHQVRVVGNDWTVHHPLLDVSTKGSGYSSLAQYLIKYKDHSRG